jgi:hypothetical protein
VALLVAAASIAGRGGRAGEPRRVVLAVRASSGLADAPVAIDVRGLRAHARVVLRARWTAFGGHP